MSYADDKISGWMYAQSRTKMLGMDGWTDGQTDGRDDGQLGGWVDRQKEQLYARTHRWM